MNFFDHKGLGNHVLQLCPKVVKHPVVQCLHFVRFQDSTYSNRHVSDTADCLLANDLKLLMMDGKTVRNMYSVTPNKINLIHWCIWLVLL